ncbi:MAG: hypothetical protein GY696_05650 [Gammaproteobacteria bacterium]|nr:hypothetical protein [Gammaproteobacteria bacterium]
MDDRLEKTLEEADHQLTEIDDRREELLRLLQENEQQRESLAAKTQEAGKAHEQEWASLEERRLALL